MNSVGRAKRWVADLLTLSNGVFGFLSIATWSVELGPLSGLDDAYIAAGYIGLGMIADGLDGIVARAWGSTGLGNALDSISDAITFSVAPAVFLLNTHETHAGTLVGAAIAAAAFIFLLAGMLRLARHQQATHADAFEGLPTPWSAAALTAILLVGIPAWAGITATLALAALNVSRIRYPKTRGRTNTRATLAILALSILVIAGLVLTRTSTDLFILAAVAVAAAMVALAPLFARAP